MKSGDNDTLAGSLRERLRADILGTRLAPGQRLVFRELGTRYGVKVGVAREALAWLASQGLVSAVPHQGYLVTPLTREGLDRLIEARSIIEPAVLDYSVRQGDTEWEARVVANHHLLSRAEPPQAGSGGDGWADAHARFHEALLSGCSNPRLQSLVRGIDEEATLYRRWAVVDAAFESREIDEHLALRDLALARDAAGAVDTLRAHIAHQSDIVLGVPA